jgi:predicted RNA-binding Zn-ribbon protein involved in translation (DUF1610 family)
MKKINSVKKAQAVFNKCIKIRDMLPDGSWRCICCGRVIYKYPNASHYIPVKLCTALRFDERNVHMSCPRCNLLEGNSVLYRRGLIRKIGEEAVLELEEEFIKIFYQNSDI